MASLGRSVRSEHKDLIHDIALDYYGNRMATCSSDQSVKIWNWSEGKWTCSGKWKTHAASVWKVTWAHPLFGQLIATASFDRTAAVWEEIVHEGGGTHWVKRATFIDSRTSVTDVKFAPKQLGLQLATASADGVVRIYENIDVSNLAQWQLQNFNQIHTKFPSVSSISWSDSLVHPPMLAVACDDESDVESDKLAIYQMDDAKRTWIKINDTSCVVRDAIYDLAFSPTVGRSFLTLACASKDLYIVDTRDAKYDSESREESESSAAEAAGERSGDMSTGPDSDGEGGATAAFDDAHEWLVSVVAKFDDHDSRVWRISWNVLGNVLASSGDDGRVRLWRANYAGVWQPFGSFSGATLPDDVEFANHLAADAAISSSRLDNEQLSRRGLRTKGDSAMQPGAVAAVRKDSAGSRTAAVGARPSARL